jgi:outer membrane protein
MAMSSRAAWAIGVGLAAGALLVSQSRGQNDSTVQRTNSQGNAPAPPVAHIGCIDMERTFREYKKVKALNEQLGAEAKARQAELQKLALQGNQLVKELEGLEPNSKDYKAKEAQITQLRGRISAEEDQLKFDMQRREADALATVYREIQELVAKAAKQRKYDFVLRVSNDPITGADPQSVMAAMGRSVVHYDKTVDITDLVVYNLNIQYERNEGAGAAVKPAAATPPPIAPGNATPSTARSAQPKASR